MLCIYLSFLLGIVPLFHLCCNKIYCMEVSSFELQVYEYPHMLDLHNMVSTSGVKSGLHHIPLSLCLPWWSPWTCYMDGVCMVTASSCHLVTVTMEITYLISDLCQTPNNYFAYSYLKRYSCYSLHLITRFRFQVVYISVYIFKNVVLLNWFIHRTRLLPFESNRMMIIVH